MGKVDILDSSVVDEVAVSPVVHGLMGPHVEVRPVDAVAALYVVAGTVVRLDEVKAATGMDAVVARSWNYVVLVPPAVDITDGVRAPPKT